MLILSKKSILLTLLTSALTLTVEAGEGEPDSWGQFTIPDIPESNSPNDNYNNYPINKNQPSIIEVEIGSGYDGTYSKQAYSNIVQQQRQQQQQQQQQQQRQQGAYNYNYDGYYNNDIIYHSTKPLPSQNNINNNNQSPLIKGEKNIHLEPVKAVKNVRGNIQINEIREEKNTIITEDQAQLLNKNKNNNNNNKNNNNNNNNDNIRRKLQGFFSPESSSSTAAQKREAFQQQKEELIKNQDLVDQREIREIKNRVADIEDNFEDKVDTIEDNIGDKVEDIEDNMKNQPNIGELEDNLKQDLSQKNIEEFKQKTQKLEGISAEYKNIKGADGELSIAAIGLATRRYNTANNNDNLNRKITTGMNNYSSLKQQKSVSPTSACWKTNKGCNIKDVANAMDKINNLGKIAKSAQLVGNFIENSELATGARIDKIVSQITELTAAQIRERIYAMEVTVIVQRLQIMARTLQPVVEEVEENAGIFGTNNKDDDKKNKKNKNNAKKNKKKKVSAAEKESTFEEFEKVLLRLQNFTRPPPEARSFIFPPDVEIAIDRVFTELSTLEERKPLDLAAIQSEFNENGIYSLEDALTEFLYVCQEEYQIVTVQDLVNVTTIYAQTLGIETVDDLVVYIGGIASEYGAEEVTVFLGILSDVASGLDITDLEEFLAVMLELSNEYDIHDIEDFVARIDYFATKYDIKELKQWARNFDSKDLENLVEYAGEIEEAIIEEQQTMQIIEDIREGQGALTGGRNISALANISVSRDEDGQIQLPQDFEIPVPGTVQNRMEDVELPEIDVVKDLINDADLPDLDIKDRMNDYGYEIGNGERNTIDQERIASAKEAGKAAIAKNKFTNNNSSIITISEARDNAEMAVTTLNNMRGTRQ